MEYNKALESILKTTLPVLEGKLEKEHTKRVELFREIIQAEEENAEFFRSPSRYLKERGVLSIDHIKLTDNREIPIIDDEHTIDSIRFLREKYKRGELIDWQTEFVGFIVRERLVYSRRALWTRKNFWTKTKKTGPKVYDADYVTDFDNLDLGPLVSPRIVSKIRNLVKEEMLNERIRVLEEKESILKEQINNLSNRD